METGSKFIVNNNAGPVWYKIKTIEDNVKSNLRVASRYIQNCGAELEAHEVEAMEIAVVQAIAEFTREMTDIKAKIKTCFDQRTNDGTDRQIQGPGQH